MPQGVILCTASYDRTIRLWEPTTNICTCAINYADSQVNALAISHNKQILAAAANNHIRLFQLGNDSSSSKSSSRSKRSQQQQPQQQQNNQNNNQQNQIPLIASLEGHSANILSIGFQQEDKWMYSGSEDGTVRVWDLRTFTCQREYSVVSTKNDTKNNNSTHNNNNKKKKPSKGIRPSNNHVNSVVLHPNQIELIAGDQKGYLRIWDLTSDKLIYKICICKGIPIRSVDISKDGRTIAIANHKGDVYIYHYKSDGYEESDEMIWDSYGFDAIEGAKITSGLSNVNHTTFTSSNSLEGLNMVLTPPTTSTTSLNNSPNTSINTNTINNTVNNTTNNNHINNLNTCLVTDDGAIRFIHRFNAHFNSYILKCKIAPNCSQLATCSSDSTIRLWDLTSQCRLQKTLIGHKKWVWDCTYNSDSSYLVTSSSDLTAKLWDCSRGEFIKEYKGHSKAVVACALHDTPVNY